MDEDLLLAAVIGLAAVVCAWAGRLALRGGTAPGLAHRIRTAARTPLAARGGAAGTEPVPNWGGGLALWRIPAAIASRIRMRLRRWHAMERMQVGLRRLLQAAGVKTSIKAVALWSAAFALVAAGVADTLDAPLALLLAGACGGAALPWTRLLRLRTQRWQALEGQLPELLDSMARAMQAGQSFARALRTAGNEGPEPIASEWRTIADEINFGLSEEAALTNLAARVRLPDVRYFVAAVLIQREAGGNLAQLLNSLAALVRERMALRGSVKAMSAEGRISAWILGIMPFAVGALVGLMNPGFMRVLWTDPVGQYLLYGVGASLTLGALWMRSVLRVSF